MKLKMLLMLSFLCYSLTGFAQDKKAAEKVRYVVAESKVHFFSDAPLEDIEATNTDLKAVVDVTNNTYSFRVPIKSFEFENSLMQEHFNENYMESEKYPNSTFKGKIVGEYNITEDGEYDVEAIGNFEIHGVEQERTIPAIITVEDGVASISSKFVVKLVDHDIDIPKVVFYNIAEEIEVTINASLKKYEGKK